jgi:hypothetical protein
MALAKTSMTPFDEFARTDDTPRGRSESAYSHLNRSADPVFSASRARILNWSARYPASKLEKWLKDFKSETELKHHGAFFELYCHELLLRHGFRLEVEAHSNAGMSTTADFLAYRGDEVAFHLEAKVIGPPPEEEAINRRLAHFKDVLRKITIPGFVLSIDVLASSDHSPSCQRAAGFIRAAASSLDRNEIITSENTPAFEYADGGWFFVFRFYPLKDDSPLSGELCEGFEPRFVNAEGRLLKALERKATKYGEFTDPYVVAVNCVDWAVRQDDFLRALHGKEATLDHLPARSSRTEFKGFWVDGSGYQHTRVSAVITTLHLMPWTVLTTQPVLWINPGTAHPLNSNWWRLTKREPAEDRSGLIRTDGEPASIIFGD